MVKKSVSIAAMVLAVATGAAFGQGGIDRNRVYQPTANEREQNKRWSELLRHPTFMRLRLLSSRRWMPPEDPTDTPAPYKVKDRIGFQLFIENSSEDIVIWNYMSPYYEYRPELISNGETVSYSEKAQERVQQAESQPPSGSMAQNTLKSGREYPYHIVNLDDWYEPLGPGRYELTVRKQFIRDGDWVSSNPVYFEVIPKPIPAPIPAKVTLEIVPEVFMNQKIDKLALDTVLQVFTRNNSDQQVKVNTVGFFYALRPQLYKNNVVVAYRADAAKFIASEEDHPPQLREEILLEPGSRTGLTYIRLGDWYDALSPGSYRLIVRQRFEIDGPWSGESAPLLFEVGPSKTN